jgi:hypothetical protein
VKELSPAMIRRVLVVLERDYPSDLLWHVDPDGCLRFSADCSDLFDWGEADTEPIETREDVRLLEVCLADLREVTGEQYPLFVTELYAARKRNRRPAPWFLNLQSQYYLGPKIAPLFERLGA